MKIYFVILGIFLFTLACFFIFLKIHSRNDNNEISVIDQSKEKNNKTEKKVHKKKKYKRKKKKHKVRKKKAKNKKPNFDVEKKGDDHFDQSVFHSDSDYYSEPDNISNVYNIDSFYDLSVIKYKCKSSKFFNQFYESFTINERCWEEVDLKYLEIKDDIVNFMKNYEILYKNSFFFLNIEDINLIKKSVSNLYFEYIKDFINFLHNENLEEEDSEWCDDIFLKNCKRINLNIENILKNIHKNDETYYKLISETIDILVYENSYDENQNTVINNYGLIITDIIKIIEMKDFTNLFDIFSLYNSLVFRLVEDNLGLVQNSRYKYKENMSLIDQLDYLQLPLNFCKEDTQIFLSFNNTIIDIITCIYTAIRLLMIESKNPGSFCEVYQANQNLLYKYIWDLQNLCMVDRGFYKNAIEISDKLESFKIYFRDYN